jgi:ankyrin repeat protein
LFAAVSLNQLQVVQGLLRYGAAVNHSNLRLDTPLHIAVDRENKKIIEVLMRAGASISSTPVCHRSASIVAAVSNLSSLSLSRTSLYDRAKLGEALSVQ